MLQVETRVGPCLAFSSSLAIGNPMQHYHLPFRRNLTVKMLRQLFAAAGLIVLSTASAHAQAKITCKDGTKSKGGQGACSSHGGLAPAGESKNEMKATKAEERKEATGDKTPAAKSERMEDKKEAKHESAADAKEAAGATAECKDHSYSHAKTHRGACSKHGGVLKFLDGKK